jgi:hypothetical protein
MEFLTQQLPKREWIIENILKEKDALLWVGQEKSGKTLFSMQAFLCCTTTGHPLIDKYSIPRPRKVTYILLEGDLGESQDRMLRLQKQLDIDPKNFVFMFLPRLMFHKEDGQYGLQHMISEIKKRDCHEIVVIDPLYRAFCGSLNDDNVVRDVVTNFDKLKDALDCALVIIHHTHKKKFDIRGKIIAEGDEATFGSVWIKAWATHIIMQTYDPTTGLRGFYCNTQRGGDITKECNLKLVQPDPLYFMEDTTVNPIESNWGIAIIELLRKPEFVDGLSADEIQASLQITKNAFFKSIKQPGVHDFIVKDNNRPKRYYYSEKAGMQAKVGQEAQSVA